MLLDYVKILEQLTGKKAQLEPVPAQQGDVLETWADVSALQRDFGYQPKVPLADGLAKFVEWYRDYHRA